MTRLTVLLVACSIATPALAINETEVLRGTPAPPAEQPAAPQQPAVVEVPVYTPQPTYYYYVPVRRPVVIHHHHHHHFRH